MVSSSRLVIAAVLLTISAAVSSSSQTTPEKGATASISGKVRIKDKAVAGVIVFAEEQHSRGWRSRSNYRGATDQDGNYRITNVRAGTYTIRPVAPSFALEDYVTNNEVVISEGETVEDINFSMVPGGVITGKISDPDGKPLVEEYVNVVPVDAGLICEHAIRVGELTYRRQGHLQSVWIAPREIQSVGGPDRVAPG